MQLKTARQIGTLLRERRTQLGWSQVKLADRMGVSRLWIIQLEQGKPTARMSLVLRAFKALGIILDAGLPQDAAPRRKRR